jgi:hypothetical protein
MPHGAEIGDCDSATCSSAESAPRDFVPFCTCLDGQIDLFGVLFNRSARSRPHRSADLCLVNCSSHIQSRRCQVTGFSLWNRWAVVEQWRRERNGAAAACVRDRGRRVHCLLARQVAPLPRLRRPRHSPRSKYTNLSIPLTQSDKTATYLAVDLDSCAKAFFAIAFVIIW